MALPVYLKSLPRRTRSRRNRGRLSASLRPAVPCPADGCRLDREAAETTAVGTRPTLPPPSGG